MTNISTRQPITAFRSRIDPEDWRVETEDDDGGREIAIFCGPRAEQRATDYAALLAIMALVSPWRAHSAKKDVPA